MIDILIPTLAVFSTYHLLVLLTVLKESRTSTSRRSGRSAAPRIRRSCTFLNPDTLIQHLDIPVILHPPDLEIGVTGDDAEVGHGPGHRVSNAAC